MLANIQENLEDQFVQEALNKVWSMLLKSFKNFKMYNDLFKRVSI